MTSRLAAESQPPEGSSEPRAVDPDAIYMDVVGGFKKQRIYGLGSQAFAYQSSSASSSSSTIFRATDDIERERQMMRAEIERERETMREQVAQQVEQQVEQRVAQQRRDMEAHMRDMEARMRADFQYLFQSSIMPPAHERTPPGPSVTPPVDPDPLQQDDDQVEDDEDFTDLRFH